MNRRHRCSVARPPEARPRLARSRPRDPAPLDSCPPRNRPTTWVRPASSHSRWGASNPILSRRPSPPAGVVRRSRGGGSPWSRPGPPAAGREAVPTFDQADIEEWDAGFDPECHAAAILVAEQGGEPATASACHSRAPGTCPPSIGLLRHRCLGRKDALAADAELTAGCGPDRLDGTARQGGVERRPHGGPRGRGPARTCARVHAPKPPDVPRAAAQPLARRDRGRTHRAARRRPGRPEAPLPLPWAAAITENCASTDSTGMARPVPAGRARHAPAAGTPPASCGPGAGRRCAPQGPRRRTRRCRRRKTGMEAETGQLRAATGARVGLQLRDGGHDR